MNDQTEINKRDTEVVRWFELPGCLSETLHLQPDGNLRLHIHPIAKDVIITREDIVDLVKRKLKAEGSDESQS